MTCPADSGDRAAQVADALDNLGEALWLVGAVYGIKLYRPRRRADCADGPRPCHFVGCKFNLLIDITADGEIILNSGQTDDARGEGAARQIGPEISEAEFHQLVDAHLEWWRRNADRARRFRTPARASCVIDVIDRYQAQVLDTDDRTLKKDGIATGLHLETVGEHLYVTRERARQIEASGLREIRDAGPRVRRLLLGAASEDRSAATALGAVRAKALKVIR